MEPGKFPATTPQVGPAVLSVVVFFALGFAPLAARAATKQIVVAAASDLSFAFQEIGAEYERVTGNSVKLAFGSSGNFFSQIQNGAPFDLFFSADVEFPRKLEAAGLAEPGSLYEYAIGRIVLWVPKHSAIDVKRGLKVLVDPSIRKIAIANPQHAPYGRAAVAAMHHEGVYEAVLNKLVFAENISQAAQFVESGNVDVGILAQSLALAPTMREKGRYFLIPTSLYPPIEQGAVILKSSSRKEAAQQFMEFLKRPESVSLMWQYGFVIPNHNSNKPEKH